MTSRSAKGKRLALAGWQHIDGWLPADLADRVNELIARHTDEAERIAETRRPPGRPPRQIAGEGAHPATCECGTCWQAMEAGGPR